MNQILKKQHTGTGKLTRARNLLILCTCIAFLSLKRDGFFPTGMILPSNLLPEIHFALIAALFFTLIYFFNDSIYYRMKPVWQWILAHLLQLIGVLIVTLVSVSTVLLIYWGNTCSKYYHLNIGITLLLASISLLVTLIPLYKKSAIGAVAGLVVGSILLSLIPILYFPSTAVISDLLPIIEKQLEAFPHGNNIYQYFLLDNNVLTQAVRQPGTTLSFLPSYILGIDLRFSSLIFTLLTALFLLKMAYKSLSTIAFNNKFMLVFSGLTLFLIFPYRLMRSDLYDPVFWFLIVLTLWLVQNKKYVMASITWGIGIFTQVWFWVLTPFWMVYLYKKRQFAQAVLLSSISLCIGIFSLGPFILQDTTAYYENVFGFYRAMHDIGHFPPTSLGLSALFYTAGIKQFLLPTQFFSVLLLGIISLFRMNSFRHFIMFLTITLFVFTVFNGITWNYMFINVIVLLLAHEMNELSKLKE